MKLSILSAVYNSHQTLPILVENVSKVVSVLFSDYEIIFVDDGSQDTSWVIIQDLARKNEKVKGIRLSKNFGQHFAITAGLDHVEGDYVVLLDADLQDSVDSIPNLYAELKKGYDIVFARKMNREYSIVRNLISHAYYFIFNLLTEGSKVDSSIGTFSMLTKKVVAAFRKYKDAHRHYVLIIKLLGFQTSYVEVPHHPRLSGKSSYSIKKLFKHAIDGITSQSTKLLTYISIYGFALLILSILWSIYLVAVYFKSGNVPSGYTSLALLILFSMATTISLVGISSLYLSKIYEQVKGRPLYLIADQCNFKTGDFES